MRFGSPECEAKAEPGNGGEAEAFACAGGLG